MENTQTTVPQGTLTATALPSPTPTPQPSVLNVCTAQEPISLYRYDGRNSESKKTIFSALYGQAIMEFDELSSLLERMPSIDNGDIQVLATKVEAGDMILDAHGELTVLKQGSEVIPQGCDSAECVMTWDGTSELTLPYLQISYALKQGLLWSDGEPLTAQDVLFSYQIARDNVTPTNKQIFDLTESVSAKGTTIFTWRGLPGLRNQEPELSFWLPLPKHQLGNLPAAELLENEVAASEPLSWGAYRIVDWETGEALRFERNPFFNGAVSDNPFDFLNIKTIEDQKVALDAFNSKECDVLDSSYGLETLPAEQLPGTTHVLTPFEVGTLVFGVNPASYDDGYAQWEDERPDYFGDIRTRQAIALCIDPVGLSGLLSGQRMGGMGFSLTVNMPILPATDSSALLEAVGWIDDDVNPATARVAEGVENVPDLTPFEISLYSGLGELDTRAAIEVGKRLATCGIKTNVSNLPANQLYAPGPEGILFGRQFDLAIVNWAGYTSTADHCEYYLSSQVPNAGNNWVGTNLAGFRDSAYDAACLAQDNSESAPEILTPVVALDLIPRYKMWISQVELDLEK
ncbi:MAG: ABC transporter substrate-binding protein [Anaerolineaceae bacterium]